MARLVSARRREQEQRMAALLLRHGYEWNPATCRLRSTYSGDLRGPQFREVQDAAEWMIAIIRSDEYYRSLDAIRRPSP